jgi:tetratricopeptide (TPR) repeat protein
MRGKLLVAGVAGIVAVAAMFFGGVLSELSTAGKGSYDSAPARVTPAQASRIAALERLVARSPSDGASLIELGLAYQQRARETADPTDYGRAEAALRRGLRFGGDRYLAMTGLAAVAASRHRFEEAVDLARRAIRIDPDAEAAYGILGDGLVELGRYHEGFAAFDHMAVRGSDLPVLTRVSYARELLGRRQQAIVAMRMAVGTASTAENAAWTLVQLGNLEFDGNRLRAAEAAYRQALAVFPGYSHAEAALARIDAARGRLAAAVRRYRDVVARMPLPQYAIALGDTLRAAHREAEARETDRLVGAIERLFRANGVRTELETALFDLDHGRRLGDALARARKAYAQAPSIHAEDVLAWALFKNDRCEGARAHSVRALHLGTRDALKLFHRGMIERCLGRHGTARSFFARALAVNEHFSLLYAPVAREALR